MPQSLKVVAKPIAKIYLLGAICNSTFRKNIVSHSFFKQLKEPNKQELFGKNIFSLILVVIPS